LVRCVGLGLVLACAVWGRIGGDCCNIGALDTEERADGDKGAGPPRSAINWSARCVVEGIKAGPRRSGRPPYASSSESSESLSSSSLELSDASKALRIAIC
jgi:hypothetical protein